MRVENIKAKKERIPQYDLMRAVAMFLVVYVHSNFMFNFAPMADSKQAGLYWFTSIFALVCNALFFMVSGKFNLAQATKLEIGGYRTFYIKKIIDLLLPVMFYAVIFWVLRFLAIGSFGAWNDGISFWNCEAFLKTTYQLLMSSWWFVPTIFALMIFTPFVGKMLGNLKRKESYVLLALLFGCAAIMAIERLFGHTMIFSKFLEPMFGLWVGVYMMGYIVDEIKLSSKILSRWYVAAGALIVIFGHIFVLAPQQALLPNGNPLPGWNDILSAVFYPIIAGAFFLFFKNIKINGTKVKKVIEFVGNRAFGIYLIHFCFYFSYLQLLPGWLRVSNNAIDGIAKRLVITTVIYLVSLMVATLVDLLIVNPAQKRLKMLFVKG